MCPTGTAPRTGMDFYAQPGIITSDNADYAANVYDKGHCAPAADFNCTKEMLYKTFTYVNCVLQPNNQAMHVWVTWMNINDNKLLEQTFEEAKVISKQNGKSTITFTSQRKGWERKAKQMGFTPLTWEFKI